MKHTIAIYQTKESTTPIDFCTSVYELLKYTYERAGVGILKQLKRTGKDEYYINEKGQLQAK